MMNERIKDLIIKTTLANRDPALPEILPPVMDAIVELQTKFAEKYAELIVKECVSILQDTDYESVFLEDGMVDPSISDAMILAASDIKEHFGVK